MASGSSAYMIAALLEKMTSADSDFRYMATNDLMAELAKDGFQLDETSERKVVSAVMKLLEDNNGEVQGVAVKCLAPLVKKIREQQLQDTIDHLFSLLSQKKAENLRDIASIGLKTVIQAIPTAEKDRNESKGDAAKYADTMKMRGEVAGGMVKRLVPKLVQQLKGEASDVELDTLDILAETLNRFGSGLPVDTFKSIQSALLPLLSHPRAAIRKRTSAAIGQLVVHEPDDMFDQLVGKVVAEAGERASKKDWEKLKSYVGCLGVLSRFSAPRLPPHIPTILPPLLNTWARAPDDELREYCLQTVEGLVLRSPTESLGPYMDKIVDLGLEYIRYDPNYGGDDEDEDEDMDGDGDEEDEDDEDGGGYSDDEDVSWKVRRAASRLFAAVVGTRTGTMWPALWSKVAPVLVARFSEREENVRTDVIATAGSLIRQTGVVAQGLGFGGKVEAKDDPRNPLQSQLPKISKSISKALVSKSVPTRLAAFQLLRELVGVLPGGLGPVFSHFVSGIESSLSAASSLAHHSSVAASTNTNLRIEVLGFLRSVFASHAAPAEAAQLQPFVDRLAGPVVECCDDRFYRIASEGLSCGAEMVKIIRPFGGELGKIKPGFDKHVKTLFDTAIRRLSSESDLEVKERSLLLLGTLLSQVADVLDPSLVQKTVLPLLLDRLKNELTRLVTVRVIQQVAEGPLVASGKGVDFKPVLAELIGEIASLLRKSQRPLRVASLSCLDTLIESYGGPKAKAIPDDMYTTVLTELKPLLSDSDLNILPMAMSCLATVLQMGPNKVVLPPITEEVVPTIVKLLVDAPHLVGSGVGLESLVNVWKALVTVGGSKVCDSCVAQLMAPVNAGGLKKQSQTAIATSLATLYLNSEPAAAKKSVKELVASISNSKTKEDVRILALLTLGEVGRTMDLSAEQGELTNVILGLFKSPSEEVKHAAAFCLGNLAVGNLDKYVPMMVKEIRDKGKINFLVLVALKETITRYIQGSDTTKARDAHEIAAALSPASPGSFKFPTANLRPFPYAAELWPLLFQAAEEVTEEGTRNVIAESLGKLSLSSPSDFLPDLQSRIGADKAATRATVVTAIRYTFSDHTQHKEYDGLLAPLIPAFLKLMRDPDLNVRRVALATLNSAAHNKPHLIRDSLGELLPLLYEETNVREELIRVVEMGPFKHKVDDGLEIRKSAYECMYTLLDTCLPKIDIYAFLSRVLKALDDPASEIKILSHLMFQKLAFAAPTAVAQRLDDSVDVLKATVESKTKANAVKQELEKNAELVRSGLRCALVVGRLSEAAISPKFDAFLRDLKAPNAPYADDVKALSAEIDAREAHGGLVFGGPGAVGARSAGGPVAMDLS
ncbi:armadillo-type protein [Hyaloraphidium curvatum]|nr:armadillo-type protein [Hyaloraphidium curvatum]